MRANRYVSYLAAEIEPQALANARSFERQIEQTLARISQKSSQGSGALASSALGTGVTRNLSSISSGATRTKRDLDLLDATQVKTSRSAAVMGAAFSRSADALQVVQGPLGPLAGRLSALGQVLRSLSGFTLAAVLGGGGAFALGGIATQYQKMHDTLVPVIGDQKQLKVAMGDVIAIAGRTHQALQPVAELYTQFTRVGKDAHLDQQRIARLTETVSKATKIGGGDPEAQRGAIIQFGQALTANFHGSGQELQSILEQTPALAQAIADGLGTQTSKLKQLAKEGQLSTDLVVKALEREADTIDERFGRMPARIGKSLQDLENSAAVFVGKMDEATGATTGVANAISFVADHLRGVVVLAGSVAAVFSAKMFSGAVQGAQQYVSNLATVAQLTNEQTRFNAIAKEAMQQQAAQAVATTEAEITGAREYQAQLRANVVLIERQIAAQTAALEMARTLDAGLRTGGGQGSSRVLIASYDELQASERALAATQAQLTASDAELTAAEVRLAAATQALVVADEELMVAETEAAAVTGRLALAKSFLQGAVARVGGALSGLVGFMGGPLGVAFAGASVAVMLLASQHDYAKEAVDRFAGSEEALLTKLENTTGKIRDQADAALSLARAFHQADIAKAQQGLRDVSGQASGDLNVVASKIDSAAGGRVLPGIGMPAESTADAQRLRELARTADTAALSLKDLNEIQQIISRHPEATKSNFAQRLLGRDPGRVIEDLKGVYVAAGEVLKAQHDLDDFDKRRNEKLSPLLGSGGGKPTTKAALNAQAKLLAATDPLSKARAELQVAMQAGPKGDESSDDYKQRIAGLIQNVNSLVEARKAEKAATAAQRKEQTALNKEMTAEEKGRDNASKLANVMDQYSDDSPIKRINQLRDAAARAKRQIDDLIGERVGATGIFTPADAAAKKAQIDAYEKSQEHAAPVQKILDLKTQELAVTDLISRGLGDQAEFIRRKVELEKQYGPLTADEEQRIRDQITQENRLNDVIAKRSDIVENNARFLQAYTNTVESSIKALLKGDLQGSLKNFVSGITDAYLSAKAHELTVKLIGDPEKRYRDEMTRGLNSSAAKLTDSGTNLDRSANALEDAAGAIAAATAKAPVAAAKARQDDASLLVDLVSQKQTPSKISSSVTPGPDDIVVTGRRLHSQALPKGIDSIFSSAMSELGSNLASMAVSAVNSAFGGVGQQAGNVTGGKLSDFLGTIGQAVGQAVPELAAGMAITSVVSKAVGLPNFAGGAFGVIGNLVAKLFGFGKAKVGSATISNLSGNYGLSGNSPATQQTAIGAADNVTSGLQRVLDALGGTLGNFAVSIGYNVKDKKFIVDPSGAGRTKGSGTLSFDSEEEATRAAILDALRDGAIRGIHEGAQRLLQAGRDLDTALAKAVKFEDVFRQLKHLKDPVGAAIDDLNTQFQDLISIFTEAGASAQDWSQLQELYDLQRADAIKQATQDTVSALKDFIQSMTSGQDSPLSRRTVYDNARAQVDTFRADIAAGKPVDQDALVKALNDMEQASQTLFGSRNQFYADFQDILALANKAKDNATGTSPTAPLPPSPFDQTGPWSQFIGGQTTTNTILTDMKNYLAQLAAALGGGGGGGGSSISALPYYAEQAKLQLDGELGQYA